MCDSKTVLWEASDRVCGKRLRPLVPVLVDAMERHGHLQLAPEVRAALLAMSAATIDGSCARFEAGQQGGPGVARPHRRSGAASRYEPLMDGTTRRPAA